MALSAFKPVRCKSCGSEAVKPSEMYDWVILDGLATVKEVRSTGIMFVVVVDKNNFCCMDCLVDYVNKQRKISEWKDKKLEEKLK